MLVGADHRAQAGLAVFFVRCTGPTNGPSSARRLGPSRAPSGLIRLSGQTGTQRTPQPGSPKVSSLPLRALYRSSRGKPRQGTFRQMSSRGTIGRCQGRGGWRAEFASPRQMRSQSFTARFWELSGTRCFLQRTPQAGLTRSRRFLTATAGLARSFFHNKPVAVSPQLAPYQLRTGLPPTCRRRWRIIARPSANACPTRVPIVCACMMSVNDIIDAVRSVAGQCVPPVGRQNPAGTNCGSYARRKSMILDEHQIMQLNKQPRRNASAASGMRSLASFRFLKLHVRRCCCAVEAPPWGSAEFARGRRGRRFMSMPIARPVVFPILSLTQRRGLVCWHQKAWCRSVSDHMQDRHLYAETESEAHAFYTPPRAAGWQSTWIDPNGLFVSSTFGSSSTGRPAVISIIDRWCRTDSGPGLPSPYRDIDTTLSCDWAQLAQSIRDTVNDHLHTRA